MAKILLVEDDKSLREIYGVRLQAEGYTIVSAGDGEEALATAIKERPDLIISDVMMPKISGFDMLDILRSTSETKGVKVIMMTALSSDDQRARGESLGADRYLVKSQVGIEDVVRTVHDVLGDGPAGAAAPAAPAPAFAPAPEAPLPVTPDLTATAPAQNVDFSVPPVPEVPVASPEVPTLPEVPTMTAAPLAPAPAPAPAMAEPQPAPAAAMPGLDPAFTTPATPVAQPPAFAPAPAAPVADPTQVSPAPAPFVNDIIPPAPAGPVPAPAPAPASQLPAPTAPFSSPAPASLGDHIIQPLTSENLSAAPATTPLDLSAQMAQALGDMSAAPAAPVPAPAPQPTPVDPNAPSIPPQA